MKSAFIITLVPLLFHAQVKTELEVFDNSRGSVFNVIDNNFKSYPGIDGTPYLDENFQSIKMDGYNKLLPNLRYNAYEDEMEFKKDNALHYVIKTDNFRIIFQNSGKVYCLQKYRLDDKYQVGYLQELINGKEKFSLYKKESKYIVDNKNSTTNTYLKQSNPYFEKNKDVILLSKNKEFYRFPKNSKELKTLLSNIDPGLDYQSVESFIKSQKLSFSKENDAAKLVLHLNKL